MILTLHVPPLARGKGQCDTDSFYSRKIFKKWEVLARRNETDY